MAAQAELVLNLWLHPSMQMPFQIDPKQHPFRVQSDLTVVDLMEQVENLVEDLGTAQGHAVQMQIQVLWNVKDHKKALNPRDTLGQHFETGDTFGVYGDVVARAAPAVHIPEEQKLPVTILTGFLGAGKTTLLNYILQEQRDMKIAVIENEFGEIPIDDALLQQNKLALAEKVVVMDNGCMCCTVRGDLLQGVRQILDETRRGNRIDAVIIETTGMADPVPIVRTFMTTPELQAEVRLDGVVTVADAKHILSRLDDQVEEGKVNEAFQQVAYCDRMLLNKLDLVTPEHAIAVKERLRSINAFAKIIPSVRSRVKVSELLNLRAHDMTNFVNEDIEKEAENPEIPGHGEGHGGSQARALLRDGHEGHEGHGDGYGHDAAHCEEGHAHGDEGHGEARGQAHGLAHGHSTKKSRHDSRVNSFSVVKEGEILPEKLGKWMQQIGQLPKERGQIFRIKGILAIRNHPFKHVFHAVMDVSDEDDAGPWAPGEKKVSKMVFIGKGLDREFIQQGFESIFAP